MALRTRAHSTRAIAVASRSPVARVTIERRLPVCQAAVSVAQLMPWPGTSDADLELDGVTSVGASTVAPCINRREVRDDREQQTNVDPEIELVEQGSEVTLLFDDRQAMQAWERDLMFASADLLCEYGSNFLEVGLGLGLSALRIAENPRVRRHVVVEKYKRVIDLFTGSASQPAEHARDRGSGLLRLHTRSRAGQPRRHIFRSVLAGRDGKGRKPVARGDATDCGRPEARWCFHSVLHDAARTQVAVLRILRSHHRAPALRSRLIRRRDIRTAPPAMRYIQCLIR